MKYFVFIKNRFNQVACVGEAEEFQDGIISLDLDTPLPEKTKIILTPQEQTARVIPMLRRVK